MKLTIELLTGFTQGLGIALVAAQKAQVPVTLVDANKAALDKGLGFAGESAASPVA